MRRLLNVQLVVLLLAVVTVVGGGVHLVHRFQVQRNARALLNRARSAEAVSDWAKAAQALDEYLQFRPQDGGAWESYARVLDRQQSDRGRLERVFLVHEQALRHNPGNASLERRCADLAIEMRRFSDARRILRSLDEKIPRDSRGQPAAADRTALAELEDLQGQCDVGQSRFDLAAQFFNKALELDPGRISCYDRLARLLRSEMPRQNEAADGTVRKMVAKNPNSGRAYLYRWRYMRDHSPPADTSDLQKALELAPEDSEVLLTAAAASEQKADTAAARAYFEKGLELDPKNLALALGLASLESRERHHDRAEKVLRKALIANPSVALIFTLAEALILQGKIEGNDQAGDYIARLRNMGLGESYVLCLEAEILFQQKKWAEAIPKIEQSRVVLQSDPRVTVQLNLMLAECHERLGSAERRVDALRQVADRDRGPESARIALADALARTGKLDEALAILSPLADRQPGLKRDVIALLIEQTLRLPRAERRWEEVERRLREAEQALPGAFDELIAMNADVLSFQGKADAAREILERAMKLKPKSVRVRIALADWLLRRNEVADAERVLDQAERDLGTSPDLLRSRIGFWSRRGGNEAKEALGQLALARHLIPAAERTAFLDELARAYIRLGETGQAAQLCNDLAILQPENLEFSSLRADLAAAARDRSGVEAIVRQMKRVEGEEGTRWRAALAAFHIGEIGRTDATTSNTARDEARKLVAEILARRGDWSTAVALRARLADLAGKPEDAVRDYLLAIDLGAIQPELARRLVELLYQLKRIDEIDQVVQKLSERGMALDELKLVTAINALRRQDFDRAVAAAREVIPDSSTSYFDLLFLSRVLLAAGRTAEAEKPLKRALELAPGVSDVWVDVVRFLVEARRTREIPRVLEQARLVLPKDRVGTTLAICQTVAGNNDEAARLFQSALSTNPDDPMTLCVAAEYYIKVLKTDKAAPLIDKLLDPRTRATPADVAWANRARGLLKIGSGDQRQIDQALALIDQNLKDSPFSFEDQRARAVLLSTKPARRAEAIRSLETFNKAGLLSAQDRFLLAKTYLASQDWPNCRDQMLALVREPRPHPIHVAYFVNVLIDHDDLGQAERWLSELNPTDPAQSLVHLDVKARLLKAGNRDASLFSLLSSYAKDHADQIGAIADLFERYGYFQEAEQAYRAFAYQNHNEPAKVLPLARFLARRDRAEQALSLCSEAWGACPPEPVAAASVAILAAAKNITAAQRQQVESWLEDALKRRPGSTQLQLNLATLRNMQQRYDQSELLYRDVLRASPNNIEVLNNLAWLLAFQAGKEPEALELVDRAIEIVGSDPTLLDTRAVVSLQLTNPDAALKDLNGALAADSKKLAIYFHLARTHLMKNSLPDARNALRMGENLGLEEDKIDPLEREIYRKLRVELNES